MTPTRGNTGPDQVRVEMVNVWQLTGVKTWTGNFAAHDFLPLLHGKDGEGLLVFVWEEETSYVGLHVSTGLGDFQGGPGALSLLADYLGDRTADEFRRAVEPSRRHFLLGRVRSAETLAVTVRIDTDDGRFLADADRLPSEGEPVLERFVSVVGYCRPAEHRPEVPVEPAWQGRLVLAVRPARPLPPYDGVVALDLGNSSCSLVAVPPFGSETADLEVIPLEEAPPPGGRIEPIPSAVRLLRFRPVEDSSAIAPARWSIGRQALHEEGGWSFLRPRRLLGDSADPPRIWLGQRLVAVPRALPAELLLSSLLKGFFAEKEAVPTRLAVTCPGTASRREVLALRQAVQRAWLRARRADVQASQRKELDALVALVLDEATAAALYFLYRDHVQAPGGLRAFRYLYPAGLNLLLVDCGGGSTTTTLLHAHATSAHRVSLRIRGRSGLRRFGGDDVTAAIFRLLKAKMAFALSARSGRLPPYGETGKLEAWLKKYAGAVDALVPTLFNPDDVVQESQRARRQAAFHLWKIAEDCKRELARERSSSAVCRPALGGEDSPLVRHLVGNPPRLPPRECLNLLRVVSVTRDEVDPLVRDAVRKAVDNANRLIAARLAPEEEVHAVYIVGNAWRYPLVQGEFRRHLQVRYLEADAEVAAPGRLHADDETLDHAAARGAALALQLSQTLQGTILEFDNDLAERLPFDVQSFDATTNSYRTLFDESTLYTELGERVIEVPSPRGPTESATTVHLFRAWPGEAKPERYLQFRFGRPLRGPLRLRYASDQDLPGFVLTDTGQDQEARGEEVADTTAVSPIESGRL